MSKRNLMNNTKTRRKGSMLQDSLSKIKYLFVLAVLLVLPMQAMAGSGFGDVPIIDQTDTGVNRLVAFWDTRGRDTFIQVTNTSSEKVNIHVQLFDVASQFTVCEECDFDDMLTPNDTHVYDVQNLVNNFNGNIECEGIAGDDTYGVMVVSLTNGPSNSLIGMFRIIDGSGYEYRTNAAGEDVLGDNSLLSVVNFNEANGNSLSDLVGITYISLNSANVLLAPLVSATFDDIMIYDSEEDGTSCSPTTFACAIGFMDKGIDNSLPNSKGQNNRVCATSTINSFTSGWLDMPFAGFGCTDSRCEEQNQFFVGFIGLNNGDGTGSMDSWWSLDFVAPIEAR